MLTTNYLFLVSCYLLHYFFQNAAHYVIKYQKSSNYWFHYTSSALPLTISYICNSQYNIKSEKNRKGLASFFLLNNDIQSFFKILIKEKVSNFVFKNEFAIDLNKCFPIAFKTSLQSIYIIKIFLDFMYKYTYHVNNIYILMLIININCNQRIFKTYRKPAILANYANLLWY